jgi:AcrR family transcriptional regulator
MRAVNEETGRVNQKLRTRIAIVEACREVIRSGGPVTMPAVARAALVSEPTAYRYFPDLAAERGPGGDVAEPRRGARAGRGIGGPG